MYYDKEIKIMVRSKGYRDNGGVWHDGGLSVLDTIDCDVQPILRDRVKKDFGIDEDVSWRIYSDLNLNIENETIITYNNKQFKIIKIIQWDDYLDFIVGDL